MSGGHSTNLIINRKCPPACINTLLGAVIMMKHLVRTPEQALLYLADCTLATVADMAMKKSKSKSEFQRQIAIAQSAVDWIKDFNIEVKVGSRVYDVLALPDKKVETWSRSYNCA